MDQKLKYLITGDSRGLKNELLEVDRSINKLGAGMTGAASTFAGAAAIGATALVGMGAAAIATTKQLFDLSKQAAEYGSAIFDASEKTGLHAETLSAMDFAAKQSGTSLDQITTSIAKFSKNVGAASDGSKEAAANLKALGIDPQDAINDLDGSLGKVFKRIQDARSGVEQMTLAQKAFGRSGADLLPFIKSFDGDLAGLVKRAKELGVTIDDEAARAADEFGDQLDTLNAQFAAVGRTIGMAFMPVFMDMAKATSDWASSNKDEIDRWADAFAVAARGIIGDLASIVEWTQRNESWLRLAMGIATLGSSELYRTAGRKLGERYAQQDRDRGITPGRSGISPGLSAYLSRGGGGGIDTGGGTADAAKRASDIERRRREAEALARRDTSAAMRLEDINLGTIKGGLAGEQQRLRDLFTGGGMSTREFVTQGTQSFERFKDALATSLKFMEELENKGRAAMTANEQALLTAEQEQRRRDLVELGKVEAAQNNAAIEAERLRQLKEYDEIMDIQTERMIQQNELAREQYDLLKKQNEERHEGLGLIFEQLRTDAEGGGPAEPGGFFGTGGFGGGLMDATGNIQSMDDVMKQLGATAEGVFMSMGQGLGNMVEQWVLLGSEADVNMKKMVASVLAGVAAQAATLAIFHTAMGIAALTPWGAVMYGPAPLHFKAAALWGAVAAGAALGGRALAGDEFQSGKGGAGAGGGGGSSSPANTTPISRVSDDAFISGRRNDSNWVVASVVASLERKIDSMPAEHVVTIAANKSPGTFARATTRGMQNNASLGTQFRRTTGG